MQTRGHWISVAKTGIAQVWNVGPTESGSIILYYRLATARHDKCLSCSTVQVEHTVPITVLRFSLCWQTMAPAPVMCFVNDGIILLFSFLFLCCRRHVRPSWIRGSTAFIRRARQRLPVTGAKLGHYTCCKKKSCAWNVPLNRYSLRSLTANNNKSTHK